MGAVIMRKTVLAAIGVALGLGVSAAVAQDVQTTTSVPAAQAQYGIPGRGLTMGEVERRFGAPSSRLAAIGQPPITRWVYPSFVVYFENNLVIHAVATSAAARAY
jgi:hypothetical protein